MRAQSPYSLTARRHSEKALKSSLEALRARFNVPSRDPIIFPRRYESPMDREVVGFIASSFAFGNAAAFERTIEKVFYPMGKSPYEYLLRFSPGRDGRPFVFLGHRWIRGKDIIAFLSLMKAALRKHGSLKSLFLKGFRTSDKNTARGIIRFSREFHTLIGSKGNYNACRFFFPSPEDGSACKRMNLFLRWMVRAGDGIDMRLWPEVPRSHLIVPLDTHIYRLSSFLGWTQRKSKGWKTAEEITGALKMLSPDDPLKYDFALCHYGMEYCSGEDSAKCPLCPLARHCFLKNRHHLSMDEAVARKGLLAVDVKLSS